MPGDWVAMATQCEHQPPLHVQRKPTVIHIPSNDAHLLSDLFSLKLLLWGFFLEGVSPASGAPAKPQRVRSPYSCVLTTSSKKSQQRTNAHLEGTGQTDDGVSQRPHALHLLHRTRRLHASRPSAMRVGCGHVSRWKAHAHACSYTPGMALAQDCAKKPVTVPTSKGEELLFTVSLWYLLGYF